ncbi:MAG: hypothetical protein FWG67_02630 [Defluviitaleaceae bacterium]|nr:hypothetical protein [Defluviitaleaceae bacterium]
MAKYRVIRNKKAYLKRRSLRRFLTLITLMSIFLYAAHVIYTNRMYRLDEMKEALVLYQEKYEEVMLRQGFYENQMIRLEDEDYVAMLAREHLRSLPHEIVFRIMGSEATATNEDDEN